MVPAAGLIAWLVPQALAQTWEQPLHPETSYPRELLATGDPQNIPLLSDSSHPLSRIALVGERNGEPVLTDPFSDEVFRTLTEEETATVGDSPSVMERFGELPEKQFMLTLTTVPMRPSLPISSTCSPPRECRRRSSTSAPTSSPSPSCSAGTSVRGTWWSTHHDPHDGVERRAAQPRGADWHRPGHALGRQLCDAPVPPAHRDTDNKSLPILEAQRLGYLHVDFDLDTQDWAAAPGGNHRLTAAAPQVRDVISSPASGPGASKSEQHVQLIRALADAGIQVLGYVLTGWGDRDQAAVFQDIDHWRVGTAWRTFPGRGCIGF